MLATPTTASFAGVASDPVLRALGLHERRLHRLIDALGRELAGDSEPRSMPATTTSPGSSTSSIWPAPPSQPDGLTRHEPPWTADVGWSHGKGRPRRDDETGPLRGRPLRLDEEQAALLRARRTAGLGWDNLAEEICAWAGATVGSSRAACASFCSIC